MIFNGGIKVRKVVDVQMVSCLSGIDVYTVGTV